MPIRKWIKEDEFDTMPRARGYADHLEHDWNLTTRIEPNSRGFSVFAIDRKRR